MVVTIRCEFTPLPPWISVSRPPAPCHLLQCEPPGFNPFDTYAVQYLWDLKRALAPGLPANVQNAKRIPLATMGLPPASPHLHAPSRRSDAPLAYCKHSAYNLLDNIINSCYKPL